MCGREDLPVDKERQTQKTQKLSLGAAEPGTFLEHGVCLDRMLWGLVFIPDLPQVQAGHSFCSLD